VIGVLLNQRRHLGGKLVFVGCYVFDYHPTFRPSLLIELKFILTTTLDDAYEALKTSFTSYFCS
jgi:hypothetical protein